MAPPQSDAFVKAQTEVKQLTKPLDNDQLLQLYGKNPHSMHMLLVHHRAE